MINARNSSPQNDDTVVEMLPAKYCLSPVKSPPPFDLQQMVFKVPNDIREIEDVKRPLAIRSPAVVLHSCTCSDPAAVGSHHTQCNTSPYTRIIDPNRATSSTSIPSPPSVASTSAQRSQWRNLWHQPASVQPAQLPSVTLWSTAAQTDPISHSETAQQTAEWLRCWGAQTELSLGSGEDPSAATQTDGLVVSADCALQTVPIVVTDGEVQSDITLSARENESLVMIEAPDTTSQFPVACDVCEKDFSLFGLPMLRRHKRLAHEQEMAFCPECGTEFCSESELFTHGCTSVMVPSSDQSTKTIPFDEHNVRPVLVPTSSVIKINLPTMASESRSEEALPKLSISTLYECKICHCNFLTENRLEAHMKVTHNPNSTSNRCEICNRSCSDEAKLKKHMIFRHGIGQVEEEAKSDHRDSMSSDEFKRLCEEAAAKTNEEGRYFCPLGCKRTYVAAHYIISHLNINHNPETKRPCPYCSKSTWRSMVDFKKHVLGRHTALATADKLEFTGAEYEEAKQTKSKSRARTQRDDTDDSDDDSEEEEIIIVKPKVKRKRALGDVSTQEPVKKAPKRKRSAVKNEIDTDDDDDEEFLVNEETHQNNEETSFERRSLRAKPRTKYVEPKTPSESEEDESDCQEVENSDTDDMAAENEDAKLELEESPNNTDTPESQIMPIDLPDSLKSTAALIPDIMISSVDTIIESTSSQSSSNASTSRKRKANKHTQKPVLHDFSTAFYEPYYDSVYEPIDEEFDDKKNIFDSFGFLNPPS